MTALPPLSLSPRAPRGRSMLLAAALLTALGGARASADVVISFLHTPPARAEEGRELVISGEMFGGSELEAAQVYFRSGDDRWYTTQLAPASGFSWRAVIPAARVKPPQLEYWVEGTDGLGERREVFASESAPVRVPVANALDALLAHPSAPDGALVVPKARASEDEPDANSGAPAPGAGERTLQAQEVRATPTDSTAAQPGPAAAARAPVPGPSGAPAPQKKSKRARPSELSLFAPDEPAALADGVDQPPADSPGLTTVLGEDLLKSLGVRTAAEALAFVPGLFVTTDALGFSQASARGLRDDAGILVLYDGQPLNGAVDGRALLELPVENLERIEVLRGPDSSRFGGGALLAVVNLVPRRKDGVAAALSGDTARAGALALHGGGQLAHVQVDGDIDVRASDPSGATVPQDAWTSALRAQGLLGPSDPAGHLDDSGVLLNGGTRLFISGPALGELELKLRGIHENRGVHLGEGGVVAGDPTLGGAGGSHIQRDLLLADLAWTKTWGPVQIALRGHGSERDEIRAFEIAPPGLSLANQTYTSGAHTQTQWTARSLGAELGLRFDAKPIGLRGEVRAGVQRDWLALYQQAADVTLSGVPEGALLLTSQTLAQDAPGLSGRSDLYASAQLEWRPLPLLSLLAGLRADELPGADAADCGGAPCTDPSLSARPTLSELSPNAALLLQPGSGATIKLLAGRSFRAPTFDELSSRPTLPSSLLVDPLRGTQSLAAEQADTAALSVEWSGPLADGRGHLRAAGAFTDLSQAIESAPDGDHLDAVNAAQPLRSLSLEVEGRLEQSRRNWEMASFTWTRVRDLSASSSVWLLRDLPQVRAVLAAAAPLGPWLNAIVWIQGQSERQNNQLTPLEASRAYDIPATALVSATLRTEPLWARLELSLTLRDLLGAAPPDDLSRPDLVPGLIPGSGFSASLTARARF